MFDVGNISTTSNGRREKELFMRQVGEYCPIHRLLAQRWYVTEPCYLICKEKAFILDLENAENSLKYSIRINSDLFMFYSLLFFSLSIKKQLK